MERESPEARAAYLDDVCGSDPDLRRRVERLLDAQPNVGSFMDSPAAGPTMTLPAGEVLEGPGTIIGPYKLLEQIGEGGMGIVYMAEQSQPVRRKVALKIIKPGMDTRQVIARFEAERQALAMMDHPNIAKVLDAGATETGRPYFVMELVRGIPITDYCDQHRLPIHKRLDLFMQVCRAVQHAHQKGIIHRDIKPTNVLVTALDGVPMPRVIDFGIAKATGQSLTDKTLFTGFAQLIGTPLYMSPEQAELSAVDIDTRSDIYSLGVLLYELLTGTTPFDQGVFRTAALDEVRRIIREQEPPKPSTRLSALGAASTTVSDNRQSDVRMLSRSLRGELDWIVMKALEKDRRRRYDTASGLARDVERYLAGDAVEAGPPSGWYRLRKFVRRNRVVLTTTALVALALIAGTTVSVWQVIVARRARADAVTQRDRARTAEVDALAQRNRAEANYQKARDAVDKLLTEVGQVSLKDVPQMEPVRRRLLESALQYYQGFLQQSGDAAAIRHEIGGAHERVAEIHALLGRPEPAQVAARRAVDTLDPLAAEFPAEASYRRSLGLAFSRLGLVLIDVGAFPEGERVLRRAIEILTPLASGPGATAEDRRQLAASHNRFGVLFFRAGRLLEAENEFGQALVIEERLAAEQPDNAELRSRLGGVLSNLAVLSNKRQRDPAKARGLLERAITHQQAALAADPKSRVRRDFLRNHFTNLVETLMQQGDSATALESSRRSLVLSQELCAISRV